MAGKLDPDLQRLLDHLYRTGRLVAGSPAGTNPRTFELRCRCSYTLGPVTSLEELVKPYNAHLAERHAGEGIEPLPPHPAVRDVLFDPASKD